MNDYDDEGNDSGKPIVQLSGEDGNAFAVIGRVSAALKAAGDREGAKAFQTKALQCGSYDALLQLAMEVADVR